MCPYVSVGSAVREGGEGLQKPAPACFPDTASSLSCEDLGVTGGWAVGRGGEGRVVGVDLWTEPADGSGHAAGQQGTLSPGPRPPPRCVVQQGRG